MSVDQAFSYLETDYGFVKQALETTDSANPFRVRYENETSAVQVEGISWGSAAVVSVGNKDAKNGVDFELVPLWTLASLQGTNLEQELTAAGQAAQLAASAKALPVLAGRVLRGDFSELESARAYLEEQLRTANKAVRQ